MVGEAVLFNLSKGWTGLWVLGSNVLRTQEYDRSQPLAGPIHCARADGVNDDLNVPDAVSFQLFTECRYDVWTGTAVIS
jgi:hypothetical protein